MKSDPRGCECVKSEENLADLGTKPLSKPVIAKHWLTLGHVYMTEVNAKCKPQDVAMFLGLRFGSQFAAAASR